MEKKVYLNTGGLWLQDTHGAPGNPPRWQGNFTCQCGVTHKLVGYGKDQQREPKPNSPTIQLRARKEKKQ